MTEVLAESPKPEGTRPSRRGQASPAAGSKIAVAGLAVGATLVMVGAMSAAAQVSETQSAVPQVVRKVVVVAESGTSSIRVVDAALGSEAAMPGSGQVERLAPTPAPPAPEPQSESGGS